MAFLESSSSESERASSPNPLLDAIITGLARRSEAEGEYSDSEPESSEYSPGKEQAMIDSLYPVLEIPRGSPELGLPTTPALRCKTTVELCAKEPGEETASDDSHVYDPRVSASPPPRRTEVPETPSESSDYDSMEERDHEDDGWNSSSSDSTQGPWVVNGRYRIRPDWYHPHTKKALAFFNRPGKWPDLVDDYENWAKQALMALQLAYLKGFALGTLEQHRGSNYWREGDRKAFGIIAFCMERGVFGLKCAADESAFDHSVPRWDMRDWAVAGRKALQSKGKNPTLIKTMSGRLPRAEMTAHELWETLKRRANDSSSVGRMDGGALTGSVSPRTVLPTPIPPAPVPPIGLSVPDLMSASLPAETAPDPVTTAQGSTVHDTLPHAGVSSTEPTALGPIFFPSSSDPESSSVPIVPVPSVNNFPALTPDPLELYQQWRRFFSSNFLDNGGNVQSFSESLDIQAADIAIYDDRFAIPLWAKKMQFMDGLPEHFADVKADFMRRRGERLLLDDPEYDFAGRMTHGHQQAITWKALVSHFDVKEAELENERMRAAKEEINRQDYEREERFAQQEEARRAEQQLQQESTRREEREKEQREDDRNQGTLDSSASAAAAAASQAPPLRKEKVPPPNEPNAPLRTPFFQFASNRRRADPRKNALPARSVLKPSPPTATATTASSSSSSTSKSKFNSKLKPKKAVNPRLARCTSPAQFSAAAQKAEKRRSSSASSSKANEDERPSSSGDRANEVELPSTPVNKFTTSFKPGPPITSSGNIKSSVGSKATTKPAQFTDSKDGSPMSGIESNAMQPDPLNAPGETCSMPYWPRRAVKEPVEPDAHHASSNDVAKSAEFPDSGNAAANVSTGSKESKGDLPNASDDKTTPELPTAKFNSSRKSAANAKSVWTPISTKHQSITSGDQETQVDQLTTVQKNIIDPDRVDVDPRTLPDYFNACQRAGHVENTRRCPKFNPTAGKIIGYENHRGPVLGKSEQERLLREKEEVAERERKQKAKEAKKAARAARKEEERVEQERLEQERLEKESAVEEKHEEESKGNQANAETDDPEKSTTAPSTAAGGKGKKKKKSKANKAELQQANAQDTGIAPEPKVKAEPVWPQSPKSPAVPPTAGSSNASAGTKRNIDEVEEAAPVDKAERKRRKKEKRRKMREEKREAKL